jgi:predicted DsbA family dithiol-disulfide isomerase
MAVRDPLCPTCYLGEPTRSAEQAGIDRIGGHRALSTVVKPRLEELARAVHIVGKA